MRERRYIIDVFHRNIAAMLFFFLSTVIVTFVDSIIISRYIGTHAMDANGIMATYNKIISTLILALTTSIQLMSAKVLGKGQKEEAMKLFSMSVVFALAVSLVLASITFFAPYSIARFFGAYATPLRETVVRMLMGSAIGLPAMFVAPQMMRILQLSGNTKSLFFSMIALGSVNVMNDIIVVKFLGGDMFYFTLGSSVAWYVLLGILHAIYRHDSNKLSFHYLPWDKLGLVLKTSLPTMFAGFGEATKVLLLNLVFLHLSCRESLTLANFARFSGLYALISLFAVAVVNSVSVMVAIYVVEKNAKAINLIRKEAMKMLLVVMCSISVVLFIFGKWVVGIWCHDVTSVEGYSMLVCLRLLLVSVPVQAFVMFYNKYITGVGHYKFGVIQIILSTFVFPVAFTALGAWIGSFFDGVGDEATWIGYFVGHAASLAMILVYSKVGDIPLHFISKEIRSYQRNQLALCPITQDEAVETAEKMQVFCNEHGVSRKQSYLVSLCCEELCNNVVEAGHDNNLMIRVRVLCEPSKENPDKKTVTLTIQDNGSYFDPVRYYEQHPFVDRDCFTGLHLVFKVAHDVKYVTAFRMNTSIITL